MLTPWKESYGQLRWHIKNQRHYFADKSLSSKTMIFPVVMYRYGSWTINNTGELMPFTCKYLESPLNSKDINPVNPNRINPKNFCEGLMMKLKLYYFGHLM